MNKLMKQNLMVNVAAMIGGLVLTIWYPMLGSFFGGMGAMGLIQTIADAKIKLRKMGETAVSPVIGVILMVAITVILAAIVFTLVSEISDDSQSKTPRLSMNHDNHGNYTVLSVDGEVSWEDVLLTYGCLPSTPMAEFIHAADEIHCNRGVKLTIVYLPTDTILYRDN